MRGIVQDSDDRMGCLLYKLAVDMDMLVHLVMCDYRYSDEELQQIRQQCLRRVNDTNGRIHLGEKGTSWRDLY
ncbi:MAG: hypothetical protein J6J01_02530 [Oscillospiraceae bacterium]|nr:hypothetical protein [Oscillospiraceae bacterium]